MATYTPILHIQEVAPTQNNKETTLNTAFAILEGANNATLAVNMSSLAVALTQDQFTRYMVFKLQGHGGLAELEVLDSERVFVVDNDEVADVDVVVDGGGTITVPGNKIVLMQTDGAGGIRALSSGVGLLQDLGDVDILSANDGDVLRYNLSTGKWEGGSFSAASFLGLTDTPANYTGAANRHVRVNAGATGLVFDELTFSDVGGFPAVNVGNASKILAVNLDGTALEWITPASAGAVSLDILTDVEISTNPDPGSVLKFVDGVWTDAPDGAENVTFLDLEDTPNSYATHVNKYVKVNAAGDALVFQSLFIPSMLGQLADVETATGVADGDILRFRDGIWQPEPFVGGGGGVDNFLGLNDTPGSYTGQENKFVKVNAGGTALVFQSLFIPSMLGHLADVETGTGISDGDYLRYRNSMWQPEPPQAESYDFVVAGKISASGLIKFKVTRGFTLADDFAGAQFAAQDDAAADTTYSIKRNGASVGTAVIASGTQNCTFSTSGSGLETWSAGDTFEIEAPAVPDTTLFEPVFTFLATRTL